MNDHAGGRQNYGVTSLLAAGACLLAAPASIAVPKPPTAARGVLATASEAA